MIVCLSQSSCVAGLHNWLKVVPHFQAFSQNEHVSRKAFVFFLFLLPNFPLYRQSGVAHQGVAERFENGR